MKATFGPALHSAFLRAGDGSGKRSRQLQALVEAIWNSPPIPLIRPPTRWDLLRAVLAIPASYFRYKGIGLTARGLVKISYFKAVLQITKVAKERTTYIETDKNNGILLAIILADAGLKYIALPHNIEYLVPGDDPGPNFRTFAKFRTAEINALKAATSVGTISSFDAAIVRCHGSRAVVIPFRPEQSDQRRLHLIRDRREGRSATRLFLTLGSAYNNPTRIAFERYLPEISSAIHSTGGTLRVAGGGTENFARANLNLEALGVVPNDKLDDLLVECDAAIIPTVQSSGFLTRLSELLYAGVPVIVVGHYFEAAALGQYNVFMVEDVSTLIDIINRLPTLKAVDYEQPNYIILDAFQQLHSPLTPTCANATQF